jgi:TetR/AcrR family transcriptional repressor of nem operon
MNQKHDVHEILDKGIGLIRSQGYTATGTQQILSTCGMLRGSFYNFFKNKEDFGIQVLNRYVDASYEYIQQFLEDKAYNPVERFRRFYQAQIASYEALGFGTGCLLANLTQEMSDANSVFQAATLAGYQKWGQLFEACLREGQQSHEIRQDYTVRELSHYLQNSFNGALLLMKAQRSDQPLKVFYRTTFDFLTA